MRTEQVPNIQHVENMSFAIGGPSYHKFLEVANGEFDQNFATQDRFYK
jgi:hypothetical protein